MIINSFSAAYAALDRVQGRGDLCPLIDVVDDVMDFALLAGADRLADGDELTECWITITASTTYREALSSVAGLRAELGNLEQEIRQCA